MPIQVKGGIPMEAIYNLYELKNIRVVDQHWYYVILLNPNTPTEAGKYILQNFNIFHFESGKKCQFFLPGFGNTNYGPIIEFFDNLRHRSNNKKIIHIDEYGSLKFSTQNFVRCYQQLENNNAIGWKYLGECEILLFNIENEHIRFNDFYSYNLDDIIRNGQNIYPFIKELIQVGADFNDPIVAKKEIDDFYAKLIIPEKKQTNPEHDSVNNDYLAEHGFIKGEYIFFSYKTTDYAFVSTIYNKLNNLGVKCWMAPYDIPSGTSYLSVIENAISNAGRFVLFLSPAVLNSIWIEKELSSAIEKFKNEDAHKICVAWVNGRFKLSGGFAFALQNIQISTDLENDPDNYLRIVSPEQQPNVQLKELISKTCSINQHLARINLIIDSLDSFFEKNQISKERNPQIYELFIKLKKKVRAMKKLDEDSFEEFSSDYTTALSLLNQIQKLL